MQKKIIQYVLLAVVLSSLLAAAFIVQGKALRLLLVASISLTYLAFGLLNHYEDKSLSEKVFLEYAALASLTFIVLYSLLLARG
ncbi:MAG: hypothetical protein A3F35_02550 [Candidatus Woykebacteria bacterium RIFCSPHIGHO2_12_FULL_45_10]|uniref:Uncharacterized protein n=1 Tax=Candidatus Woykebacteria bacterium RIFCSPHIGHO2_12_FULL_45_10 TaxID=1802603 RepID=A0A1G1WQH9_9BACT|nr:MAG: hypothetical protein A3F35_02550 [Candidatus Woykebacteria bacterium RIFCSPHIGHO2_12_FULL_45_10]